MLERAIILSAAVALCCPAAIAAQAPEATDVTRQELLTVLEGMGNSIDRQIKVGALDIGNIAVGILRRGSDRDSDGEPRGLVHTRVSEVYYILSGGGTLLTGGEHVDQGPPQDLGILVGPSYTATSEGGTVRAVWEGDIVIIPAGTVHVWLHIPDEVVYVSIRPDPHGVLPAGYVNPEIVGER